MASPHDMVLARALCRTPDLMHHRIATESKTILEGKTKTIRRKKTGCRHVNSHASGQTDW